MATYSASTGTSYVWVDWCSSAASGTTDSGAWTTWSSCDNIDSTGDAWQHWSGSTTDSSGTVWQTWCNGTAITDTEKEAPFIIRYPQVAPSETEEQRRAREALEDARRAERERYLTEREEANRKAMELLREELTEDELAQYDECGYFILELESERRYAIDKYASVKELDKGNRQIASYCIHTREGCPVADEVLAKKLLLECDEEEFHRIANRTAYSIPTPLPVAI